MQLAVTPARRRLCLALLAWAELIVALDVNIVYIALPDIGRQLAFSSLTLQWVVSAYAVTFGGFLLLGGRCADRLGRRRMFLLALSLFAGASLAGALAPSAGVLVAARAIQGLGGALLFPTTLALVNTMFPEGPARNRALAVWGGAGSVGLSLGSLVGGVLTGTFGWPMVFYANVLMAAIGIAAALPLLPRDDVVRSARTFDLRGALLATIGVTAVIFALVQGPDSGWTSPPVVLCAVAAVALLVGFVFAESRSADPLMPLRLVRTRTLGVALLITLLFGMADGSVPYFFTVYLQQVHGYGAFRTGLAYVLPAVFIVVGTQLSERLIGRLGTRTTLVAGNLIGLAGTAALAWGMASAGGAYPQLVPGLVGWGLGQGIVWTAMWVLASTDVEPREQGVASGIASTGLQSGIALGLAITIAIANSGVHGLTGAARVAKFGENIPQALYVTAAGLAASVLVALVLSRRTGQARSRRPADEADRVARD
ncbi:MFS transporter [Saccharopolyspora rosea]|uniref:MFS transporter n=1 Tax=Saccharopolyspora rosea TaxID=524884 RepID=A0ABW3FQ56_9PSEU|nr:MFS transporter [Saccharopolyspora rosea]